MQTFLVYSNFNKSAQCLDYRRLGKQRVEAYQILIALTHNKSSGWKNHPAVKMWQRHEKALAEYGIAICSEWQRRGYNDMLLEMFEVMFAALPACLRPWWSSDERFLSAHRAALLAKDFGYYSKFGWTEEAKIDYFWPTKEPQNTGSDAQPIRGILG